MTKELKDTVPTTDRSVTCKTIPSTGFQPERVMNLSQLSENMPKNDSQYIAQKAKTMETPREEVPKDTYFQRLGKMLKQTVKSPENPQLDSPMTEKIIPNQFRDARPLNTTY